MASIKDLYQTADWKAEKHVPVIDAPENVEKQKPFIVTVSVGKEIAHPNTSEHFISWISLYFQPKGEKFPYEIGRFEFSAHGSSAQGPNTSTVYTQPSVSVAMKTEKPGTLHATAYCNIHGLWEFSKEVTII